MGRPVLHGASYSVYVRIVCLALHEKGVEFEQVPVDIFSNELPSDYSLLHPFGKIPVLEHDGFRLFETSAITRYVDETFSGPPLQPESARARARTNQLMAVLDNYAYKAMVWDVFAEQEKAGRGGMPDASLINTGVENARRCLEVMQELKAASIWLAGDMLTLADLHCAPMVDYFLKSRDGAAAFAEFPDLSPWWEKLSIRASVRKFLVAE